MFLFFAAFPLLFLAPGNFQYFLRSSDNHLEEGLFYFIEIYSLLKIGNCQYFYSALWLERKVLPILFY